MNKLWVIVLLIMYVNANIFEDCIFGHCKTEYDRYSQDSYFVPCFNDRIRYCFDENETCYTLSDHVYAVSAEHADFVSFYECGRMNYCW